jgi:hypothetical protein
MTDVNLLINHTTQDSPVGTSGTEFIQVDPDFDYLLFTQGSLAGAGVSDGDALPSEALLNRYAVQLDAVNPVIVPKYLLADFSVSLLKECKLAGNQNKRYAFAASFDGPTATEPQLEAWDNATMNSYLSPALGTGTPASSWYKAVCTTAALPGVSWVGTPLAGSGSSNIVLLNAGNGALTVAGVLYFNFKVVIPGGYTTPALHTPILAIVYATN